jgi:hypothetical protein
VIELEQVPYESDPVTLPDDALAHRNGAAPSDDESRLNAQV